MERERKGRGKEGGGLENEGAEGTGIPGLAGQSSEVEVVPCQTSPATFFFVPFSPPHHPPPDAH